MSLRPIFRRLALPLALAALAGCGDAEDRIPLVPVGGKVTRDGAFMADASVAFHPAPGNSYQTPGGGKTDSSGMFSIRFRNRDGLAVGHYKVIIVPDDAPDIKDDSADLKEAFKDDPNMLRMMHIAGAAGGKGHKKAQDSGSRRAEFEVEVASNGLQRDFEMKEAGGAQPAAPPTAEAK